MVSGGLESVLISSPGHGDGLAIDHVRVATLGDSSGFFLGDLFLVSVLSYLGGIGEFESKATPVQLVAIESDANDECNRKCYPKE